MNTAKLNVTVGQQVVLITTSGFPLFGLAVSRISPSGKFEVVGSSGSGSERKHFFNAQGYEVELNMNGKVMRYGCRASLDVEGHKADREQKLLRSAAAEAINSVKLDCPARSTYSKEALVEQIVELERLVRAAREAVEKID